MTHLSRKQIYTTKRQQVILKRLAKVRGLSQAEIVRQAIDREITVYAARPRAGDHAALEDFIHFGLARQATTKSTQRIWIRDGLYDDL